MHIHRPLIEVSEFKSTNFGLSDLQLMVFLSILLLFKIKQISSEEINFVKTITFNSNVYKNIQRETNDQNIVSNIQ
mgnify:CR=1 FL=1